MVNSVINKIIKNIHGDTLYCFHNLSIIIFYRPFAVYLTDL